MVKTKVNMVKTKTTPDVVCYIRRPIVLGMGSFGSSMCRVTLSMSESRLITLVVKMSLQMKGVYFGGVKYLHEVKLDNLNRFEIELSMAAKTYATLLLRLPSERWSMQN